MQLRKNRPTERNAVNAARTLFEKCRYVFQEINLDNDYGKDAYVDLVEGDAITGVCVAIQIKGGKKYKRASGYVIPIEGHTEVWRQSTVPLAGIVHDQDSEQLYWCNITQFLAQHQQDLPSNIPVSADNVLNAETLESIFKPQFRSMADERAAGLAVLRLCSHQEDMRLDALLDCFAFGRSDPRIFTLIRHLLWMMDGPSLKLAITILSHITPHPDIMWGKSNWVPEIIRNAIRPHMQWSVDEIRRLLSAVAWENWQRGDVGQDLYMILLEDPEIKQKIEQVAIEAIRDLDEEVAWAALYLAVYWAGTQGLDKYEQLIGTAPELRGLPLAVEIEYTLSIQGFVILFE